MNKRLFHKKRKQAFLAFLAIDRDEDNFVYDCFIEAYDDLNASSKVFKNEDDFKIAAATLAFSIYEDWQRSEVQTTKFINMGARRIIIHVNSLHMTENVGVFAPMYHICTMDHRHPQTEVFNLTKEKMFDLLTDEERAIVIFNKYFHKY
jgi:hypothetical protein